MGKKVLTRGTIPLRRWEDWERSRLRKLKRDERRRREMEQAFPSGYPSQNESLVAPRDFDNRSGSSDTLSLASSDEDMWGAQIGGYNEHNSVFIPPPAAHVIAANANLMASSETFGDEDMEALLNKGFDDSPRRSSVRSSRYRPVPPASTPRYQLSDSLSPVHDFQAYPPPNSIGSHQSYRTPSPRDRVMTPTLPLVPIGASSSAVQWKTHAKQRSAGKASPGKGDYGPLGPLDPNTRT
jgi:chitin synthase